MTESSSVADQVAAALPQGLLGATCPSDMVAVGSFCMDRYEAPNQAGMPPFAMQTAKDATDFCTARGKRMCTEAEWVRACAGPHRATYPYGGTTRRPGACNDAGRAPLTALANELPAEPWERMNDPRLNQVKGSVARTGSHPDCASPEGVYDLVGNLHEWVDDPEGTFLGGYYLDTTLNGPGCRYKTVAHGAIYHDYSTGFRCCRDVTR